VEWISGGDERSIFQRLSERVGGRINIDLYEYVDDSPIFQMKTLEELTAYLGLSQPPVKLDPNLYARYWESDRGSLERYVEWRVASIYNSFEIIRDEVVSLSAITGIPMDYVLTSSSGRRIEFYVMGEAVRRGELIPPQTERRVRSYQGECEEGCGGPLPKRPWTAAQDEG